MRYCIIRVCRQRYQALGAGSIKEPCSETGPLGRAGEEEQFPEVDSWVAGVTTDRLDWKLYGIGEALGKW